MNEVFIFLLTVSEFRLSFWIWNIIEVSVTVSAWSQWVDLLSEVVHDDDNVLVVVVVYLFALFFCCKNFRQHLHVWLMCGAR